MSLDINEITAKLHDAYPYHYHVGMGTIRAIIGGRSASPFAKVRDIKTVLAALDTVLHERELR